MELLEQATLVARALHTLEWLRDNGVVRKETVGDDWCRQSLCDLERLMQHYRSVGAPLHAVDLGAFVSFDVRETVAANKPAIVCLCGSTRFWRTFQEASLRETLAGKIVLSIGAASGTDDEHFGGLPKEEYDRVKEMLDALHMRKIDLCDEILALNVNDYIGESTAREIAYARSLGKRVRWLVPHSRHALPNEGAAAENGAQSATGQV